MTFSCYLKLILDFLCRAACLILTTLLKSDDAFAEQPLYFGNQEGSENFAKSNYLLWCYALRLSANVENESLHKHPFAY